MPPLSASSCLIILVGLAALFAATPVGIVPPAPQAAGHAGTTALDHLGPPSFDERFDVFDHGTDQARPATPHRWRTVYGSGGPSSPDNRQMSAASFASDAGFAGMTARGPGTASLGLDPFEHRPGQLTILAKRTPDDVRPLTWNKAYFGGAITTKFSFAQLYGYFEIEARLPTGKGMWPAFWLMPITGTWPGAGEIDVFEGLGDPRVIFCTVIAGRYKQARRITLPFDASTDFHRYGVLWDAGQIAWYVDRKLVARAPTPAPLTTQKAYMIANLAVGGSWAGSPDAATPFPGRYVIRRITAWPLPKR